MAFRYRTQGWVFKKEDRGEADQVLTIYTKDFGKIKVLGKGIRKIKSKLRYGADLFYLSEIEFIQGKVYKTLTDSQVIKKFNNDLDKFKIAKLISETLDELIKGEEKDKKVWSLIKETFLNLNNWKSDLIYFNFLWNLLSILGYKPELYKCNLCGRKLSPKDLYFDSESGGVIDCEKKGERVSIEFIKTLRIILEKDWQTLSKLKVGKDCRKLLNNISNKYLSYIKN